MKTTFVAVFAILALGLSACGGSEAQAPRLPENTTVHILVTRADVHPTYQCDGTVNTYADTASFDCTAEGFDPWSVRGYMANESHVDAVHVHIFGLETQSRTSDQPDIAVSLIPNGDRFTGWATVILPDGTGSGHAGATAEAWLESK